MAPNIETPTDSPKTNATSKRKKGRVPQRGVRKRILGDGDGDFCVVQISDNPELPKGCLLPIPEAPRFETIQEAKRWCTSSNHDLLAGKNFMIFKAMELGSGRLKQEPQIVIDWKPKRSVMKDTAEEA